MTSLATVIFRSVRQCCTVLFVLASFQCCLHAQTDQTECKRSYVSWLPCETPDAISKEITSSIVTSAHTNFRGNRGVAYVEAKCGDINGQRSLSIDVTYHSDTDKSERFETSGIDRSDIPTMQELIQASPNLFDLQRDYDNMLNAASQSPSVRFRLRMDEQVLHGYSRSKYDNVLTLSFFDRFDKINMLAPPHGRNLLPPVASLSEVASAKHITLALPLADGETPIVELDLTDRTFRKLATQCAPDKASNEPGVIPEAGAAWLPEAVPYSVAAFTPVLADALSKAAMSQGMQAHAYDAEADYIAKAVSLCATVTPQMALDPTAPSQGSGGVRRDAYIHLRYGEKYRICQGTDSAAHFYLGNLQDVSLATNVPHGDVKNPPWGWPGDVMLFLGQRPPHAYNQGAGFDLTVSILLKRGYGPQNVYQDVLPNVHILPENSQTPALVTAAQVQVAPNRPKPAAPSKNVPFQDPVFNSFVKEHENSEASSPPPMDGSPNSYYARGKYLLLQSSVDPKTGHMIFAPGCQAAFQKYLQLAPQGEHAAEVRQILQQSASSK